jgi:parallel beta-helix repeat protein
MEETKLPPLEPVIEPDSLDAPGAQVMQPEAGYASNMQYPIDQLDVHEPGYKKITEVLPAPTSKFVQLSRRRALIVSSVITLIVVLLTGLSAVFFLRDRDAGEVNSSLNGVSTQDVQLDQAVPASGAAELQGTKEALLVNGNVITRGELQLVQGGYTTIIRTEGGASNNTFLLPNSSGTVCLNTNNCSYASQADLESLTSEIQDQLGQLAIPATNEGVNLLNNQNGAISIQGTSNQISVATNNGVITLSTPQDIASISSPTFANLLLTNNFTVNGVVDTNLDCSIYANQGTLTTNASGQIVCADDDGGTSGVSTPGGTTGALAVFTAGQTIADSIISQALGTATVSGNFSVTGSLSANTLSLVTALGVANGGTGATTLTSNGVLLGNGSGAVATTAAPTGGQVLLGNGSGVPTFTSLSGDIAISATGVTTIQANSVALSTDTTGNYVASLVSGNGISVGGAGEGATPTVGLTVLSSDWDQTGAFDLVLNNAASELRVLESAGATFFGTLDVGDLSANRTYTLPDSSGTVCLDSGNCLGGAGGAPNSASYITLTNDATLSGERAIAAGTNLGAVDGGANGSYTLNVVNNPTFSGLVTAGGGIDLGTQTLQGTTAAINLNNFDVDSSGNITNTGTYNGQTISASSSFTGSVTVSTDLQVNGNTVLGNTAADLITIAGVLQGANPLVFEGITSDSNQITIAIADPGADRTYTIPFVGANADFCLSSGNCAGVGGGVTTSGGNTNRVAKFTSSQAIGDSTITDDGTNVSITGNFALQGGVLTIGTVTQAASIALHDGDGETVTFNLQDVGANYTLTLPAGVGSANQCLKAQNGTGTLYWDDCLGGGGTSGISSVDGQSGPAININNATGSSNIITIDNAVADGATKGIAAFNATNFSAASGIVNTVQNIDVTATPTFGGLTLNGAANLGANTLQGTTAVIDFANFDVSSGGNVTAGTYNGQTISSTASLTGTLDVTGLTTLNGGLTIQSGDTLTFNGETVTDLSGSGLQISANSLGILVQANKGLEVDGSGLSLIDCAPGEILKYNGSNQWACDSDAGGSGLGDNISVNGTGATDANFVDTTASGTVAGVTWLLSNVPNPDEISLTIGAASGTEAGVVTTGIQTFAGDKTFSGLVTLEGNVAVQNGDSVTINGDAFTDLTGTGLQITLGSLETTLGTSIDLTAEVTGTLGVGNGGTGATTLTANGILFGNGAGVIQATGAAADSILATNGSNVPSLVQTLPTTVQGNITSLGTITSGIWNGTAITDTYVTDTLTVDASSTVAWTALNGYPAACSAGEAITQLGDSVTCAVFAAGSGSGNYIQNQNSAQQSASNFWISGSGRADTSLLSPIIDTPSAGTLTVGGTNATAISLADDTTLSSGKFLRITGDNTAGRPASPSAGMLFYDTTTNQLLQYNGTKWVSDRTSSTKIVAPSNASQAQKDGADYITDGTADEVEINAALTAATGGRVYLQEGTYTIAASISVPNNTTLAGAGRGTLITVANSFNTSINAVTNTTGGGSGTGIVIRDVQLDGNSSNQSSGTMHGIYLDGVGSGSGSSAVQGAKITNVWTNNWRGSGVILTTSTNSSVMGSTSQGNTDYGFYLEASSTNNNLSGNTAQGNARGFYVANSSSNTISGNNSQGNSYGLRIDNSNNNVFSANTLLGNTSFNFTLLSSSSNTLSNNTTYGSSSAFSLTGTSQYNIVSSNTVQSTSASAILLDTGVASNTISNNNVLDSGGASLNAAISLNAADNNSIIGNTINDSSASVLNYAIDINDSGADNNYVSDNYFSSGSIHDIGTGTIYGGQVNGSGNFVVDPSGTIELQSSTNVTGNFVATGTGSFTGGSLTVATTTATDDRIITQVTVGGGARFDGTITNTDLTAARTWTLPNESGTFCMQGSTNCGFAPSSGSGNYIQNQNSAQQAASNFWISGSGRADTSFLTPAVDTATATVLSLGTATASSVSLGRSGQATTVNGTLTVNETTTAGGNIIFATGADRTVSVQTQTTSNTAGNNLTVQAATGNGTGAGGNAILQAGASGSGATGNGGITYLYGGNAASTNGSGGNIVLTPGTKTGSGSSGQVLIKPAASNDASNTLQVQNAAGTNILQIGTSDQTSVPNLATNGSVEQNTTNWVARTGTTMTRTSTYANTGSYSVSAATNAVDEGLNYSMPNLANGTYIFTAYVRGTISSSVELGYSADGSTESSCAASESYGTGGWKIVKCGSLTATSWNSSAYIFIRVNSATSQTVYIDGLQIASGNNVPSFANGTAQLDAMITSRINIMTKEDSESAFSIQSSSGNGVFSVNTETPRVGIGLDQPNAMLHIARLTTSDDLLRVTGSGATLLNVFEDGSNTRFTFTTANNNTTAFRVMNSSSNAALTVDTANNRVKIDADTQYTQRLCHSGSDAAAQADVTLGDCNSVGQADLAEMYDTNGNLEPGDVVYPSGQYKVDKTSHAYQKNAIGVVSTNPTADGIIGNNVTSPNRQPVALAGRIPVKVSLENGPISAGDFLAPAFYFRVCYEGNRRRSCYRCSIGGLRWEPTTRIGACCGRRS